MILLVDVDSIHLDYPESEQLSSDDYNCWSAKPGERECLTVVLDGQATFNVGISVRQT